MDDTRLDRLLDDHGSALLAFLTYRTGDRDVAEDLLADTMERAIRARRRFDPRKASERTWLTTIALNAWRDHERRRATEARHLPSLADRNAGGDFVDALLERDRVNAALAQLPPDEREALALVYGADLTQRDAATALGVKLTTVQGRVYRGLKQLRETLEQDPPGG